MVAARVPVGQLDRLAAEGETQELMAEADPEDRDRAIRELADRADGVRHRRRVAGAVREEDPVRLELARARDRKSTRLNSSHANISYAVFCLKKKKHTPPTGATAAHRRT